MRSREIRSPRPGRAWEGAACARGGTEAACTRGGAGRGGVLVGAACAPEHASEHAHEARPGGSSALGGRAWAAVRGAPSSRRTRGAALGRCRTEKLSSVVGLSTNRFAEITSP